LGVPHLYCLVAAPRGDALAVAAERHTADRATWDNDFVLTRLDIPHPYSPVPTSPRGKAAAVAAERHAADIPYVPQPERQSLTATQASQVALLPGLLERHVALSQDPLRLDHIVALPGTQRQVQLHGMQCGFGTLLLVLGRALLIVCMFPCGLLFTG